MKSLSKAECEIYMIVLNDNGITMKELLDRFSKQRRMDYARTTVVTFVERLERKGYVTKARKGRDSCVYCNVEYKDFLIENTKSFIDTFFSGNIEACIDFITKSMQKDKSNE